MMNDLSHHPWGKALTVTLCLVGVISLSPVAFSYAKRLALPPVPQASLADAPPANTPLPLLSLEHPADPAPQATHGPSPQVYASQPPESTGHKVTVTKAASAAMASSDGSGTVHPAPVLHTSKAAPTASPAHAPVSHALKAMPHKTTELTYKASHAATKSSTSHHEAPTTSHHETPLTKEAHATEPVAHEPPATPPQAKVTTPQPSPPVTPTKAPPLTYKQAPLGGAQGGAATKGLTQVLLGLLGVLGLVFLVAKLAKIYLPLAVGEAAIGGGLHKLQVLDTLTLGAHHQLKLVAGPQGEQLLLAQTAQGLSLLKSWPANSTTIPTLVDDTLITLDDYLDEAIIPLKSKRG